MAILILISIFGALITYELAKRPKIGGIRASAGTSLVFALYGALYLYRKR